MDHEVELESLVRTLRPLAVKLYAESRGWLLIPLEDARYWLLKHPEHKLRQLLIPMDADDVGFADAMLDVVRRLAEIEGRRPERVIDDLQFPDADVLRIRISGRGSETGQLSLAADVDLREGARRALLASACSVVNPVRYHPRLSRSEADALLAACRVGQTERGSYVVKVICPLHAVELPNHTQPFTREVTTYLMRATSRLVGNIEQGRLDEDDEVDGPPLSWNLCDALLRMQPDRDGGQLELSTKWAVDRRIMPPPILKVPARVAIKAEYFAEIEHVAKQLRPISSEPQPEQLVGTVEQLLGVLGTDGRRAGEVQLTLLKGDEQLRARVMLEADQYEVAIRAHEGGQAYVVLRGVLHRGPRMCRVEEVNSFDILDNPT